MKNIQKLHKLFFYAGVEKAEYNKLLPGIREENRLLLLLFSQLAVVMFFLLFVASMVTGGFATVNTGAYLISGIVMLGIFACVRFLVPKHPALVMALVYLFEIVLFVFGIRISMLHADKPAVSAIAFLLVSPLLFYDRPVRLSAMIGAVAAVFCAIVVHAKEPDVADTDVWNMITFGIVAVVTTVFIMSIKFRALAQSRQIEYLSQTDLLTGIKNRNHYENRLPEYPRACASRLVCVYADVNGLHEMNNRYGHPAGDKMLRDVAAAMLESFGPEHSYRVGGDEFVGFSPDGDPDAVSAQIQRISRELNQKGYHVSFGIAGRSKEQNAINMNELVKEAESRMFAAKREFYRQSEHDRRNR